MKRKKTSRKKRENRKFSTHSKREISNERESHKPNRIKHLLNKMFLLNTRRVLIILAIWAFSVIVHIIINLIFKIDEKIFFLISGIILPFYLLISILFFTRRRKEKE